MRKSFNLFLSTILAILLLQVASLNQTVYAGNSSSNHQDLSEQKIANIISSLPKISGVEEMESDIFKEKYKFFIEQPIDHKNPSLGTFKQRVYLMNVDVNKPMVIVTEGYIAKYAANPKYRDEISKLFNTNLIVVEHRYFNESFPENPDWRYLTAENSANDHHNVVKTFKNIYKDKWVATGISKGGQTALIYRAFFPEDVDITVPYVAPLCKGAEDGRHEPFLREVTGTDQERDTIQAFQIEYLKRKDRILPLYEQLAKEKSYQFNASLSEIYDFTVLEFPFAFWQWGLPVKTIPAIDATDKEFFDFMLAVSGPDYFINNSPTTSFFVQAAKELGYYGYDIKPFKEYLDLKCSKDYLRELFLPAELRDVKFDNKLSKKLRKFVATTDAKMIFIYGEFDPWSAVMVKDPKNENVRLFVDPKGSHRARISTLPTEMNKEAIALLDKWLNE